jgi:hypothetical protein
VLILVAQVAHGMQLAGLLPEASFAHGGLDSELRRQYLTELEQKLRPIMIATTLADEGLDVPTLGGLILAGGGKSSGRGSGPPMTSSRQPARSTEHAENVSTVIWSGMSGSTCGAAQSLRAKIGGGGASGPRWGRLLPGVPTRYRSRRSFSSRSSPRIMARVCGDSSQSISKLGGTSEVAAPPRSHRSVGRGHSPASSACSGARPEPSARGVSLPLGASRTGACTRGANRTPGSFHGLRREVQAGDRCPWAHLLGGGIDVQTFHRSPQRKESAANPREAGKRRETTRSLE